MDTKHSNPVNGAPDDSKSKAPTQTRDNKPQDNASTAEQSTVTTPEKASAQTTTMPPAATTQPSIPQAENIKETPAAAKPTATAPAAAPAAAKPTEEKPAATTPAAAKPATGATAAEKTDLQPAAEKNKPEDKNGPAATKLAVVSLQERQLATEVKARIKNLRYMAISEQFTRQFTKQWRSPFKRFALLVLIPTLVVSFYYLALASDMYVSKATFAIRSPQQPQGLDFASAFLRSPSSTTADSYLVYSYVHSWDLISAIDSQINLQEHFSDRKRDFISRLKKGSTQDELLKYWKWASKISFDPDTGIITTEVKAYTPEMAQRINTLLIKASEDLLNEMNKRSQRDSLALAKEEVALAERRLAESHLNLRALREESIMLDPKAAAETLQTIIVNLEVEAAKVAAELNEARAYMKEGSPRVESLKRRLEAIQAQLVQERDKISGLTSMAPGTNHLTAVVGSFEDLLLAQEFAKKQYASALTSLEMARIQGEAKNRYLVPFQQPMLPDESLYPKRLYFIFLTFIGSILIFGLGSLVIAAIREHAGF